MTVALTTILDNSLQLHRVPRLKRTVLSCFLKDSTVHLFYIKNVELIVYKVFLDVYSGVMNTF